VDNVNPFRLQKYPSTQKKFYRLFGIWDDAKNTFFLSIRSLDIHIFIHSTPDILKNEEQKRQKRQIFSLSLFRPRNWFGLDFTKARSVMPTLANTFRPDQQKNRPLAKKFDPLKICS
jgi:hypothetical protein